MMEEVINQVKVKKKSKILLWVVIANIVLWSTLVILLVNSQPKKQSTPQELAYTMAKMSIEKNLKSPSTAEYQAFSNDLVASNGNTYKVSMWVDSENSFGAKIRANFEVYVKNEGDKWYLVSIKEL